MHPDAAAMVARILVVPVVRASAEVLVAKAVRAVAPALAAEAAELLALLAAAAKRGHEGRTDP